MQHKHMVCRKVHICHDRVLDQNANDNAHSTPVRHEDLDTEHKIVMLGISLYHNIFQFFFSNIRISLNTILSVCPFYFTGSFSVFDLINDTIFPMLLIQIFLKLFSQTDIIVLCKIMNYNLRIKCF